MKEKAPDFTCREYIRQMLATKRPGIHEEDHNN